MPTKDSRRGIVQHSKSYMVSLWYLCHVETTGSRKHPPPLPRLPAADRPLVAPGTERPRLRGEVPAVDPLDVVPGRRSRGVELVRLDADGDHRGVLEEGKGRRSHLPAAGLEAEHVEPDLQCSLIRRDDLARGLVSPAPQARRPAGGRGRHARRP